MYQILDIFFFSFHSLLILFNLFGWLWNQTRKLNLITLLLTAFSWVVLGFWYGFGYCFCTDWHWQVRRELGYAEMPNSYITFLVEELTGFSPGAEWVNILTVGLFAIALGCSIYVNFFYRRER